MIDGSVLRGSVRCLQFTKRKGSACLGMSSTVKGHRLGGACRYSSLWSIIDMVEDDLSGRLFLQISARYVLAHKRYFMFLLYINSSDVNYEFPS